LDYLFLLYIEHQQPQLQAGNKELTKLFGQEAVVDTSWNGQVQRARWFYFL
jgi:hypothetical protein